MKENLELEEYKNKLLQLQKEIFATLEEEKKEEIILEHYIGDELDMASESSISQLQQILAQKDVEKLTQITYALKRIEDKSYNICENCTNQIGKQRLLALPFTRLCIQCQSEQESHYE